MMVFYLYCVCICVCVCVHLYDGFFYFSIVGDCVMVSALFSCCSSLKCCSNDCVLVKMVHSQCVYVVVDCVAGDRV